MEKQTVFIKKYPSKGELPKIKGEYIIVFNTGKSLTASFSENSKKFTYKNKFNERTKVIPNYWLQEIELPSDEDIKKEADRRFRSTEVLPFKQGAKLHP